MMLVNELVTVQFGESVYEDSSNVISMCFERVRGNVLPPLYPPATTMILSSSNVRGFFQLKALQE